MAHLQGRGLPATLLSQLVALGWVYTDVLGTACPSALSFRLLHGSWQRGEAGQPCRAGQLRVSPQGSAASGLGG